MEISKNGVKISPLNIFFEDKCKLHLPCRKYWKGRNYDPIDFEGFSSIGAWILEVDMNAPMPLSSYKYMLLAGRLMSNGSLSYPSLHTVLAVGYGFYFNTPLNHGNSSQHCTIVIIHVHGTRVRFGFSGLNGLSWWLRHYGTTFCTISNRVKSKSFSNPFNFMYRVIIHTITCTSKMFVILLNKI